MVVWIDRDAYLDAQETCELLSVKPQTLYAYVSRGLLRSFRQGIKRRRLYLKREAEALVRLTRGKAAHPVAQPAAGRGGGKDHGPAGRGAPAGTSGTTSVILPRAEEWVGDL
jgi:citrate synthase